ncbi:hypothetical protein [Gemmatimonas sp.]|uniref:hypothetical protein n=1 Tax=Gemmatimonas sp. TaxID=1962908 RepID=UPI00391F1865
MSRSVWSRWTILLLALVASLASPAVAVAHGVAHAHEAEAHGVAHVDGGRREAPAHDHDHDHDHDRDHDLAHDRDHDGHSHHHARLEPVAGGRAEVGDDAASVPVTCVPPARVLPLAVHAQPPLTRWDTVALARPAPDTGPPPALRAPPTC